MRPIVGNETEMNTSAELRVSKTYNSSVFYIFCQTREATKKEGRFAKKHSIMLCKKSLSKNFRTRHVLNRC